MSKNKGQRQRKYYNGVDFIRFFNALEKQLSLQNGKNLSKAINIA